MSKYSLLKKVQALFLFVANSVVPEKSETAEHINQHLLIYMGILMGFGGILWGTICLTYGLFMPATIPYGYTVLTIVNFALLARYKNFASTRFFQVLMSLLLPFMFQWSLGGFVASGAVMLWSMLALVGSLAFQEVKTSRRWLIVYLALTILSGFLDPYVKHLDLNLPPHITTLFFVINITTISAIIAGLSFHFLSLYRKFQLELEGLVEERTSDLLQATQKANTERKAAEDANRAKSTFLATMSHEIRTPMNGVIGMVHLALNTRLTAQQKGYLNNILSSSQNLLGVINDILDFSKIEAGKLFIDSIQFKLDSVIENISSLLSSKLAKKDVELLFEVKKIPAYLRGDPLRLGQILINLTSNAIKFTERGEILVTVCPLETQEDKIKLQFAVKDSGIGMSQDQVEQLFQPFTQADNSITRQYGGTGLGLSITKRLTALMGGEISVSSKLDEGSTFTFTAWFGYSEEEYPERRKQAKSLAGLRGLIVDDSMTSRDILSNMLQEFAIEKKSVESGIDALHELKQEQEPYDFILLDWRMPEMNGVQVAERIRQEPSLKNLPIIMVSASEKVELHNACKDLEIDNYLTKPISASTLLDTLSKICNPNNIANHKLAKISSWSDVAFENHHILLVEDNEINQQIAVKLLQSVGLTVTLAKNGLEAVEIALSHSEENTFDAILMDVQMPKMDGYQATHLIRQDNRYQQTPIIALTAHALIEEQQRSLEKGMSDHITKPIEPQILFATLAHWLKVPESTSMESIKPAKDVSIPELPGFDTKAGLSRVANDKALYFHLLRRFVKKQKEAPQAIQAALEKSNFLLAEHITHTLKGIAGNIGATLLQKFASQLEQSIKFGESDQCFQALQDLAKQLQQDLDTLSTFIAAQEEKIQQRATESDLSVVQNIAQKLYTLLLDDDGEALDVLNDSWSTLMQHLNPSALEALQTSIHDFDFEEALVHLRQIAQESKLNLEANDG